MCKQLHRGLFFNNFVFNFKHSFLPATALALCFTDLPVVLFCSHFYVLYEVNSTVSFSFAFDGVDERYPKYRIR